MPQSLNFIAISALVMLPGYVSASFLTKSIGRKKVMIVYIGMAVIAGYMFANARSINTLYVSNYIVAFFSMGAWGVWNTWVAELYPTHLRTTGYSAMVIAQHLANVTAPILIGVLVAYEASFHLITTLINMFMAVAVLLIFFLPETEGEALL